MKMNHFLSIADYSEPELMHILDVAKQLKAELKAGGNQPILAGKTLALVFQKASLRTRVSFEIGMHQLGGYAFYLAPDEIGLGKREAVKDVAQVLGGFVDAIMARVFEHKHLLELAQYAGIPIINGLSDYNHPCQGMADALTIIEEFGQLKDINVSFIGDMPAEAIKMAEDFAAVSGSKLTFLRDPKEAASGAQVLYTDTWVSMGQEAEKAIREKIFQPYQINQALVDLADKDAIVMHCLPAHRGQEITDEVQDGPHSRVFPEAHNRLHAQKGVLACLLGGM